MDARGRQSARARLRGVQAKQGAATRAYDRAVQAVAAAQRSCAETIDRARASVVEAIGAQRVALAALAATIRDPNTTAAIAAVPPATVRRAVRDVPAEQVEAYLAALPIPQPLQPPGGAAGPAGPAAHAGTAARPAATQPGSAAAAPEPANPTGDADIVGAGTVPAGRPRPAAPR